ncbi:MAG: hypothetical protein JXN62_00205 [Bacteroidales bacterium]|nr:hypothetical protein [Bacteroidales bacterium]
MTDVYNKKKEFNKRLKFAKKGPDLRTGNAEAKGKFYYQPAGVRAGKIQRSEALLQLIMPFTDLFLKHQ